MQRNFLVKKMARDELTPLLSGLIRHALMWVAAPLLSRGVPLHNGQQTRRRMRKEINQLAALVTMATIKMSEASLLGSTKIATSAAIVQSSAVR